MRAATDHQEAEWEWEELPAPVPLISIVCGDPIGSLKTDSWRDRGIGNTTLSEISQAQGDTNWGGSLQEVP